jgi:hypothetical protein
MSIIFATILFFFLLDSLFDHDHDHDVDHQKNYEESKTPKKDEESPVQFENQGENSQSDLVKGQPKVEVKTNRSIIQRFFNYLKSKVFFIRFV